MVQTTREGKPIGGQTDSQLTNKPGLKKSYVSPRLVEYGSITKLTQSGAASGTDLLRMMNACL